MKPVHQIEFAQASRVSNPLVDDFKDWFEVGGKRILADLAIGSLGETFEVSGAKAGLTRLPCKLRGKFLHASKDRPNYNDSEVWKRRLEVSLNQGRAARIWFC